MSPFMLEYTGAFVREVQIAKIVLAAPELRNGPEKIA
jgi:hypothetical protein